MPPYDDFLDILEICRKVQTANSRILNYNARVDPLIAL